MDEIYDYANRIKEEKYKPTPLIAFTIIQTLPCIAKYWKNSSN